ncbi:phosphoglycerate mutase-like protein [Epithele typhae]|uniref:phosphoglycerate mutase-like protein n=1 Tax=Epithele typhae TaxID=378194 RepID=UPI002007514F|nr:phosphoglycerate mutase-like protein [Epithele typhae]KAH9919490.1 phosphoglycerate mutase-like protein [Epithele typhae]
MISVRTVLVSLALLSVANASGNAFKPLQHSGPASPYFDAPAQFGIGSDTPAECKVEQAAYIVRHGSRYPEPGSYNGWVSLYEKFQNATFTAKGPLAFIPSWTVPVDNVSHEPLYLSSTGAREAFDLGVDLRKRYGFTAGGDNFTVWAAGQQRVMDTATWFVHGYLSAGNYLSTTDANRGHIVTMPDSVNYTFADSLTPSAACPTYKSGDKSSLADSYRALFRPAIAARLNKYLDGLELDETDIGVMQDLCGFQTEVSGDHRFCDVFEDSEWLDYEYAHDLNYYYGAGPGNPFSAVNGIPYVKAATDLLVTGPNSADAASGNFTPSPLIMSFTHDNNLPPVLSALGLWNTSSHEAVYPLSSTKREPKRTFRSSYVVSFRGFIALERLSCDHAPGAKKYIRVKINNAVTPVPGCQSGPGGSCPLASFDKYVAGRAATIGDFKTVCGLEDVANATSELDIYTNVPSTNAESSILQVPLSYAGAL